jgi:hypothetical protein
LSSCFWREFQTTPPTVAGTTLRFLPAVFAHWHEFSCNSWDACAVNILMASLANGDAVRHVIAQFGMILPGLFVVRLDICARAALLAGVIVSIVNGLSPAAVLAGVALFVCVWFALGGISTFFGAILDFQMPARMTKAFSAILANQRLSTSGFACQLTGATAGTGGGIKVNPPLEGLTAYCANPLVAIWAVVTSRIMNYEGLPAFFTVSLKCKGLSIHDTHYNTFRVQRWADMTGQEPVLVE